MPEAAVTTANFNSPACNVFLCKGLQFADNTANVQNFTAGQVINMLASIPIPHEGPMNISIINTKTNTAIESPLISFDSYADESLAQLPANNTNFNATIPNNLGSNCAVAGTCALQWFCVEDWTPVNVICRDAFVDFLDAFPNHHSQQTSLVPPQHQTFHSNHSMMSKPPVRQPLASASTNIDLSRVSIASLLEKPLLEKPAAPAKRKAEEIEDIDSDDDRLCTVDKSCNQKAIGCSSNAYSRFMGQNGPDKGAGSDVYYNAFKFFKKRELQGKKVPKKVKPAEEAKKNDVSAIHLEGEDDQTVPVYDSCDEIRKKINAYLREPGVTQAGFLREIAKAYPEGKKIQSKVLNDFLGKRGATAGNTSSVFYGSYVFFEKMRIRDGKPKSKHRETMEKEYRGKKGMDTKHRLDGGVWCSQGERPYEDKYGKLHIERKY
ncbi:hypothetical protein G7Y89_g7010 [Cudoniella acicularis]|uniref:DUF7726 domain-containing protein n=1 Tax=Cudoniella acicularis TaxID=354080 RepID=A0A8H4W4Z0_9HELO|nr:hypothetical protein G7Y89_g7010 [Cudoniella acicularis]